MTKSKWLKKKFLLNVFCLLFFLMTAAVYAADIERAQARSRWDTPNNPREVNKSSYDNKISTYNNIKIELIENPEPTHFEKESHYKKLILIKELSADFDEEYFLADPTSIAVDDEGNIFTFDNKLNKIFKFSKDYKFIKAFGMPGQGPGEFEGNTIFRKYLNFTGNGSIYLCSTSTKKIIEYKTDGSFAKEIKVPQNYAGYVPLLDKDMSLYLPSKAGAVAVYNKDRKKIHTYLDRSVYRTFVLMKPFKDNFFYETAINTSNTAYDLLSGNRFIIYIFNSSTVYLFKGNKLEKKIRIWPKEELKRTKQSISDVKKVNKDKNWMLHLFNNFFVDKDDAAFFYLESAIDENNRKMLYKFSLDGELVNILYIDREIFSDAFYLKKNGLIYGISYEGEIKIMKE